jgi:hypothetical protein
MHDITITKGGDTLAHIQGETDAGIEFVDGVVVPVLTAIDSGRIVIPESSVDGLVKEAQQKNLSVHIEAMS